MELSRGKEIAKALQAAQANTRETYPHPFHWAPFMLAGRNGSVIP